MPSSPFDRLSTEVIQEIFSSCIAKDNPTSNEDVIQFALSQVCSKWRSIILNTPQFWDNFILSVDDNWLQIESAFQLASWWFNRAGSRPITLLVWLGLPQHRLDYYLPYLYDLMVSHRFKSLTGDFDIFYDPLHDKAYEESFASLESLSLNIPKGFSVDSSHVDGDNCCPLPSLRSLSITFRSMNIPWKTVLAMIPWHKLTKLTLDHIVQVTMMEIMHECKALVECSLSIARPSGEDVVTSPSISLPHLRNLKLASSLPISDLVNILSTFKVPNLTSVYVMFESRTDSADGTDLLSSQFDAPLQQLQPLQGFTFIDSFNDINPKMFLRRMPSLRRLKLRGYVMLDRDTTKKISTGQLGSCIDTLTFSSHSAIPVRRVLDMIEKRQQNAKSNEEQNLTPFVHVKLRSVNLSDKFKKRIERLESQDNVRIDMNPILRIADGDDSDGP